MPVALKLSNQTICTYTYFIWKTKPNILFYCYFRFTISFSKWIKIMLCCISDLSLDFLWEWRRVVYCPVIKMKGNKIVSIAVIKWQSDDRAMKKVHCTPPPLWSGMCPVPVQWRRWWCDMWTDVVSFIPNQNLPTKKPRLSLSLSLIHIRPK